MDMLLNDNVCFCLLCLDSWSVDAMMELAGHFVTKISDGPSLFEITAGKNTKKTYLAF